MRLRLAIALGICLVAPSLDTTSAQERGHGYDSANSVMPGCRAFIAQTNEDMLGQGYCAGLVDGLVYADRDLCLPAGATVERAIKLIVQYIDAHSGQANENFRRLALEALRQSWPCKH